jgi:maleylacetoacetate isomerase
MLIHSSFGSEQRVPAIEIDGHVLAQSGAILEYLEETRPERALLPTDPFVRAQVRSICLLIAADIQPFQNSGQLIKVRRCACIDACSATGVVD